MIIIYNASVIGKTFFRHYDAWFIDYDFRGSIVQATRKTL